MELKLQEKAGAQRGLSVGADTLHSTTVAVTVTLQSSSEGVVPFCCFSMFHAFLSLVSIM